MIHTIYSNSYEVLRAVLLNNIDALRLRPEAESLRADECFAGVFDRVPVIIPSKAVETDLVRAIAKQESVCASMRFMFLSEWLWFFPCARRGKLSLDGRPRVLPSGAAGQCDRQRGALDDLARTPCYGTGKPARSGSHSDDPLGGQP